MDESAHNSGVSEAEVAAAVERTTIRPAGGLCVADFIELWRSRELLAFLALRDVQLRYRQTLLGVAWAVLQPVLTMALFSLVFGRLAGLGARVPAAAQGGAPIPYPLYTLAALLPWQLFAHCLAQSSASLVTERGLLTKVYFPRLILPAAPVLSGLVDFFVALLVLVVVMALYGTAPGMAVLLLPAFVALAATTAFAVGLWLAALNALYRDVKYVLPFLIQLWLFATPIAYPAEIFPQAWRPLLALNPMAGVVEGFRWALLRTGPPPLLMLGVSSAVVVALLAGGLVFFRRMELAIVDEV